MRTWIFSAVAMLLPLAAHADDAFTVLVVGGAHGDAQTPTLDQLKQRLQTVDPTHAVVVFTGDYMAGELPGEDERGRAAAEAALTRHVDATRDFAAHGGRVYFLPGSQDFASHGAKAVNRLRRFLNRAYATDDEDVNVMPLASCGDPTLIELTPSLGLVLVNSEWWLQDWASDPQANQGCEVPTRAFFEESLRESLRAYRHRRLIIASHHPLRSVGPFGGSFTASAHLHPAPLLGSLWVLMRAAGLIPEYENHPMMRSYTDFMLQEAQRNGEYVFASGHDADLQYLHIEKQIQIVSGASGRSATPNVVPSARDFAAQSPGWAEIVVGADGEGETKIVANGQQLFAAALPKLVPTGPEPASAPAPFPQGPVTTTYTRQKVWHFGSFLRFFVGSFYSDAYALQLPFDTLDLETEGFKAKGTGGGLQTLSLKLRDKDGAQWALRGVAKDSSRVLPWPQNQATFINRMLDHGYTATHPEAALTIPRLAEALGVLHADPRLLYLPDQEALGDFRGYMADKVVLLEERAKKPKKDGELPASLAGEASEDGETKFKSTPDLIQKLIDKPDKNRLDQEAMLRARLLDNFVGDWDRHQGQWSFAGVPDADGMRTYSPIPRDRDQALANYNGAGLWLARLVTPGVRTMQPFTGDYGSVEWLNYNARNIDPVLLNQIPHERWLQIARDAQAALTDQVIDEAFAKWHTATYALDGARLAADLKVRRDHLVEVADELYTMLARHVDILGSSGDDIFDVWAEDGGALRVTVRTKHKKKVTAPFFDRTFVARETSELRIYALAGDDTLVVHGALETPIEIRFVGGPGRDTVTADGAPARPVDARAIRFYDTTAVAEDGGTIDRSVRVKDERSRFADKNQWDWNENHDPDTGVFFPSLSINPDDGAFIGGTYTWQLQGFKAHPFASSHQLSAAVATATGGVALAYHGLFPESVSILDQHVDLIVRSPNYSRNFYGITNKYVRDPPTHDDYYRLRQADYEGRYGLSYGFGSDRSRIGAQVFDQLLDTENTRGRWVSESPDVTPDSLGRRNWSGVRVFASTNTFDDLVLPKRGIALNGSIESHYDLVNQRQFSTTFKGVAAFAFPFDRGRRFVLLSRVGVEGLLGDHPFYFAPTLGGYDLRAYHYQQFAGDFAFAQTTDLRIDFLHIMTGLPSNVGLNLSLDHGSVFGHAVSGDYYHMDYGGGLWWSALDYVGVQLSYYRSLEQAWRFVFTVGPLFTGL